MSRFAKMPITIPNGVLIKIDNRKIMVKHNNNTLFYDIHKNVNVNLLENKIICTPYINKDKTNNWMIVGTTRSLIKNMIIGVTTGYVKKLQLIGIGYRVSIENNIIYLSVGFSNPIEYILPSGVIATCINQTEILLKSTNKHLIGQVAANLRNIRKPEIYKGKGIRYSNEIIRIKETKKK